MSVQNPRASAPRIAVASAAQSNPDASDRTISIRDVSHWFDSDKRVEVMSRISLDIRRGQFVSLVGPSGCGKTTLLNMVEGLVEPSRGSILVHGERPRCGRPDMAYMLARDALLPWRTVIDNAVLGNELRGVPAQERRERARELLEHVGLGQYLHHFPKALSQGMRQRTALARTFALSASVLLMDEPFAALDAQTKLQLEDALLDLWQRERRTVIFVTHDLHEAVSISDRVIVMSSRPGKIHADVEINLPRPRIVRALQSSRDYHELYADVWRKLEEGIGNGCE